MSPPGLLEVRASRYLFRGDTIQPTMETVHFPSIALIVDFGAEFGACVDFKVTTSTVKLVLFGEH